MIPDARHPKVAIVADEHRVMRHVGQLPDELATAIEPLQAVSVEVEDDIAIRQKDRAVYLRVPVVLGQNPALYVLRIRPDLEKEAGQRWRTVPSRSISCRPTAPSAKIPEIRVRPGEVRPARARQRVSPGLQPARGIWSVRCRDRSASWRGHLAGVNQVPDRGVRQQPIVSGGHAAQVDQQHARQRKQDGILMLPEPGRPRGHPCCRNPWRANSLQGPHATAVLSRCCVGLACHPIDTPVPV